MIEIKDLTKTYRGNVQALRSISLDIGTGMFGLLGPNGAGKTTLMRVIAGLLNPTSGSVQVLGEDITSHDGKLAVKRQLGYLPQELGLYPNLSGKEFLDYIAVLKGVGDQRERERQIGEILELVRLTDAAHRKLKTYSGGMKRRIGIGQALLGQPKLLIVDEPTVGLDPEERVRFRNMLSDMAARRAIILSTHVIEDISHSCNDLAIIRDGSVLFRGKPSELIERARGKVWSILTNGERPNGNVTVVSTLQLQEGVQYRVIGTPGNPHGARPLEPSLEDGYMLAMG